MIKIILDKNNEIKVCEKLKNNAQKLNYLGITPIYFAQFCSNMSQEFIQKNPCQVRHFVISLSILIAAGSIFERRLIQFVRSRI